MLLNRAVLPTPRSINEFLLVSPKVGQGVAQGPPHLPLSAVTEEEWGLHVVLGLSIGTIMVCPLDLRCDPQWNARAPSVVSSR